MTTTLAIRNSEPSIVPVQSTADLFAPRSMGEAQSLATMLAGSSLIPKSLVGKPGDVLVILLTGYELGMSGMQALRSIYVVEGRPFLSAELLAALVTRSPACEYWQMVESSDKACTYETKRRGHNAPIRLTWTIEQAQRAGLQSKSNWKNHPESMLRARCQASLARAVYADLVLGLAALEELDDHPQQAHGIGSGFEAPPPPPDKKQPEPTLPAPEPEREPGEDREEEPSAAPSLLERGREALQMQDWKLARSIGGRLAPQEKTAFLVEYKTALAASEEVKPL